MSALNNERVYKCKRSSKDTTGRDIVEKAVGEAVDRLEYLRDINNKVDLESEIERLCTELPDAIVKWIEKTAPSTNNSNGVGLGSLLC